MAGRATQFVPRDLEEGYLANAGLSDQIHKEFEYVDAEPAK